MNDNYLWEKTGEDHEIAKIEEALAVFRYRDGPPPALTINDVVVPRRWKLVFAAGAVASLVIAAFVWLQVSNRVGSNDELVFIHDPTNIPVAVPVVEPAKPSPANPGDAAKPQRNRDNGVAFTTAALTRKPRSKVQRSKDKIEKLTAEERYAYQQLMLALSISSSKLRIVKDAVNGIETTEARTKHNYR